MEGVQGQGNTGPEGYHGSTSTEALEDMTRIPIAVLARIMHKAIPVNGRIHSDAKEAVSLCVSEFAAVLINEAAKVGKEESRRIVSGDDVIAALSRLGLDDYIAPLTLLLQRYRESHGIVPRGWQAELPPPASAAVAADEVEIPPAAVVNVNDMLQAPEPDLTLGLALPVPRDVTELGLHEDAYKVWPGVAGPMPPPAGGDQ